jgi:rhodanese-related sulfurtransferase
VPFTFSALPKTRDGSCAVSVADAQQRHSTAQATLIDVRLPAHFQRYHIPGSLNIALHTMKTKAFLKHTPLILVNEGSMAAVLAQACQELRQQGFTQVSVLDGGLRAWREAHGALVGDIFAQRALNYVTPEELFGERGDADWLVLDFSDGRRQHVYQWLPPHIERIAQTAHTSPDAHRAALRATVAQHRQRAPHLKVLVTSDTDEDYGLITASIQQAGLDHVLYLGSGLQGYEEYLAKRMAMWHHKNQPRQLPACQG